TAYELSINVYRKRFRTLSKQQSETYCDVAFKQVNLGRRWLQSVNAWDNLEGLRQAILMEQFLESCPLDLTVWLVDRAPTSLSQIARLADQYVSLRKTLMPSNGTEVPKPAESSVLTNFKPKWSPKPFKKFGKPVAKPPPDIKPSIITPVQNTFTPS